MRSPDSLSGSQGGGRYGRRIDVSQYDHLLEQWYVHDGCTVRETYHQLREVLDDGEWTTELGVSYRLQELGHKTPQGYFDALEAQLLELDPEDIGLSSLHSQHGR